ncbi:MAG: hypothetical protein D4R84_14935 [Rhodocyclaceae bacterium]|nr:MAG: hypothetical protein D4R84_14935 [Rhodocyclaceae bacterium]
MIKALAAAGLLGPAGISGLIRDALAKGEVPIRTGLQKVRGEVIVNQRIATEGQIIRPGDTIVTGRNSDAIYVIGQDAYMQRELTTVSFGADALQNLMRVVSGKILSVFGKGARTIRVSTATIGIRGTGCYIEDEGTGARARTYFCLCYGSVELTPTAAPQESESYSTTHHDKPMYIYNDMAMPKMMVPAGVVNHSDAELELLESLVGRVPSFYGQGGRKY